MNELGSLARKCFYCEEASKYEDVNIRNLGHSKYICFKCYKLFEKQFIETKFNYLIIFTKKKLQGELK